MDAFSRHTLHSSLYLGQKEILHVLSIHGISRGIIEANPRESKMWYANPKSIFCKHFFYLISDPLFASIHRLWYHYNFYQQLGKSCSIFKFFLGNAYLAKDWDSILFVWKQIFHHIPYKLKMMLVCCAYKF